MNYNTTYSYPRQEQMVSYQICADDVQEIYWPRPNNYNPKRRGMSPAATPTGLSGNQSYLWPPSQNYYNGSLRYPQLNPAAYGSYAQVQY